MDWMHMEQWICMFVDRTGFSIVKMPDSYMLMAGESQSTGGPVPGEQTQGTATVVGHYPTLEAAQTAAVSLLESYGT